VNDAPVDPVAAQYEQWSFPEPLLHDLSTVSFRAPQHQFKDLKEHYWAYWPSAPYREDLDILIAGCGTVEAACFAYLYPQATVVGIDVSAASLAHEEFLKKKHGLANLTLHRCRLEEVASLGAAFDFIATHGVLHHLVDPAAGLRALGEVLRPEGVIDVMVYAPYGRAGIYMLQELFRILGLGQRPQDVEVVKDALIALRPQHPVRRFLELAFNLNSAPGLVDAFLHPRDRPYTASECLDLVQEAGLAFQGWDENSYYYPDSQIPKNHPFYPTVSKLRGAALWQALELFHGEIPVHFFHVCRRDRPGIHYRLCFEGDDFLDYVPVSRVTRTTPADALRGQLATIARPPFATLALDNRQGRIFSQVDRQRTIRACLASASRVDASLAVVSSSVVDFARAFFETLWRMGLVVFRIPGA
jgi:SAM-dependent methyltransferase